LASQAPLHAARRCPKNRATPALSLVQRTVRAAGLERNLLRFHRSRSLAPTNGDSGAVRASKSAIASLRPDRGTSLRGKGAVSGPPISYPPQTQDHDRDLTGNRCTVADRYGYRRPDAATHPPRHVYECHAPGKKLPTRHFRPPALPIPTRGAPHPPPSNRRSARAGSRSRATTTTRRWPQIAALDRPAFVPRTTGRRQEMTGTAGASNAQVRNQIGPSPQVARSAPKTLPRWRHGFEPSWDYEQPAGQKRRCPKPATRQRGRQRPIDGSGSIIAFVPRTAPSDAVSR
jgi:hypothetical protein